MFFTPDEHCERMPAPVAEVPAIYDAHKWQGAVARHFVFNGGAILSQLKKRYDFSIAFHYFFLKRAVTLNAVCEANEIGMAGVVEGNLSFYITSPTPWSVQESSFCFGFFKKSRWTIHVPAGTHLVATICYTLSHLRPYVAVAAPLAAVAGYERLNEEKSHIYPPVKMANKLKMRLLALLQSTDVREFDRLIMEKKLVDDLLLNYVTHLEKKAGDAAPVFHKKVLEQVRLYVVENATEPISLQELARKFHLPFYILKRDFKRQYGYSVHDFQMQERMQLARELIKAGKETIKDIAYQCGFHDVSHFSRTFKAITGETPTDYRNGA